MGNGESSLPHRVNLIFGGRYALAKNKRGDCPVSVVPAHEVLVGKRRNHGDNRWLIKLEWQNQDAQGRPLLCIIRNDHHIQRSLRAGSPVMVDSKKWTAEHRWLLEYVDSWRRTDAVGAPFHLCSMKCFPELMYLAINDKGQAVIQKERPRMLWEFYDSGASVKSVAVSFVAIEDLRLSFPVQQEVPVVDRLEDWIQVSAPDVRSAEPDDGDLVFFEGSLGEALAAQPRTADGSRAFSSLDWLYSNGEPLGAAIELPLESATVYGVCMALYGPGSTFRRDMCKDVEAELLELQRAKDARWCATAFSRISIQIPVLGRRSLEDHMRVACCRENGVYMVAFQHASKATIGFPIGDFLTEQLNVISQNGTDGPIILRSFGLAQAGRHQAKAYDGLRENRAATVRHIDSFLRTAPVATLQKQPRPRFTASRSVQSEAQMSIDQASGTSQPSVPPQQTAVERSDAAETAATGCDPDHQMLEEIAGPSPFEPAKRPRGGLQGCAAGILKLGLIPCGCRQ